MAIPDATLQIKDGALGLSPQNPDNTLAIIGTSSSGTAGVVGEFSDQQTVKDAYGSGPLVEAACHVLAIAGGPVVLCKATSANAGAAGSVTKVGTGNSVLTTTSSTPLDSYQVQALIVQGGTNPAAGTGTFKWSLDGGRTFSAETALPSNGIYAIPGAGVTLNFSAASLVAGDLYSFGTTGPTFDNTALAAAMDALLGDLSEWFAVWAVGVPADSTAQAALYATLDSKLATAESSYRFARGYINSFDDIDANLKTAIQALSVSKRAGIVAGFHELTSVVSTYQYKREQAYSYVARLASVGPEIDPGETDTLGPLPLVVSLDRDERKTPNLDQYGYTTLRSHLGLAGFYVTSGKLNAGPTSDFQFIQYGRVMDIAARAVRIAQLKYLNKPFRVNPDGTVLEADARAAENELTQALKEVTVTRGRATAAIVTVDRTINMLSTQVLKVKYRILPLAYAKFIQGEIAFSNVKTVALRAA